MKFNSIKIKSFLYLFSFTLLLTIIISFLSVQKFKELMFFSIDKTLKNEADIIIGLMKEDKNFIELEITEIKDGNYIKNNSGHYYKLNMISKNSGFKVHETNKVLNKVVSPSLIDQNYEFKILNVEKVINKDSEIFFSSKDINNNPLRVLKKNINYKNKDIELYVSEPISDTLHSIQEFKFFITIIFLISILFSIIIITSLIKLFLKPIADFSNELSNINHKNLDLSLDINNYPEELKNMVFYFNKMMEKISKAFETEKLILSEASHKLKTPLAVIKSHCDISLKKERTKDEYIDTLKSIKSTTNKINSLVLGILSLAKLESESIKHNNFERLSIIDVLNTSIDLTELLAYQKNIKINFEYNNDYYLVGDRDKIVEAIVNIIENGIKYNLQDGTIDIKIIKNDNNLLLSIKDNGIGISSENQNKIFEKFYRVDNSIEGSGLGLNISKTIIESHNGKIEIVSEVNKGTEFIIKLPIIN